MRSIFTVIIIIRTITQLRYITRKQFVILTVECFEYQFDLQICINNILTTELLDNARYVELHAGWRWNCLFCLLHICVDVWKCAVILLVQLRRHHARYLTLAQTLIQRWHLRWRYLGVTLQYQLGQFHYWCVILKGWLWRFDHWQRCRNTILLILQSIPTGIFDRISQVHFRAHHFLWVAIIADVLIVINQNFAPIV